MLLDPSGLLSVVAQLPAMVSSIDMPGISLATVPPLVLRLIGGDCSPYGTNSQDSGVDSDQVINEWIDATYMDSILSNYDISVYFWGSGGEKLTDQSEGDTLQNLLGNALDNIVDAVQAMGRAAARLTQTHEYHAFKQVFGHNKRIRITIQRRQYTVSCKTDAGSCLSTGYFVNSSKYYGKNSGSGTGEWDIHLALFRIDSLPGNPRDSLEDANLIAHEISHNLTWSGQVYIPTASESSSQGDIDRVKNVTTQLCEDALKYGVQCGKYTWKSPCSQFYNPDRVISLEDKPNSLDANSRDELTADAVASWALGNVYGGARDRIAEFMCRLYGSSDCSG